MLSTKIAGEQFMFRIGQLRNEYNILWEHEYKGYHGLRSVNDVCLLTLEKLTKKRLTSKEVDHCENLISDLTPLIKNPISFYLISMIILLDTSNLEKEYPLLFDAKGHPKVDGGTFSYDKQFCTSDALDLFKACIPSLSEVFIGNDEIAIETDERTESQKTNTSSKNKNKDFEEQFEDIKNLQRHYTMLLHSHWKYAEDKTELKLDDTDAMIKRAIESVKQVSYYASLLMETGK